MNQLNRKEQKMAHLSAPHMTLRAFIRAYGEDNVNIWYKINKYIDPRRQYPWRWPDVNTI
jgi:hypothetical protein